MKFFSRLFDRGFQFEINDADDNSSSLKYYKTKVELIERFGGEGLEKQLDLNEMIAGNGCEINWDKGTISFGPKMVFPIQILGTFSQLSKKWVWSWASFGNTISSALVFSAMELKRYGERCRIGFLTQGEFAATDDDLHLIGLIGSGVFNSSGYYIAENGEDSILLMVKSKKNNVNSEEDYWRIFTVFPHLTALLEMNHKLALFYYLTAKGYNVSKSTNQIIGTKDGRLITAFFDKEFRIVKLLGS